MSTPAAQEYREKYVKLKKSVNPSYRAYYGGKDKADKKFQFYMEQLEKPDEISSKTLKEAAIEISNYALFQQAESNKLKSKLSRLQDQEKSYSKRVERLSEEINNLKSISTKERASLQEIIDANKEPKNWFYDIWIGVIASLAATFAWTYWKKQKTTPTPSME